MSADNNNYELVFRGKLEGHENWVTCIASGHSQSEKEDNPVLVSGSRDKSLIIWKIFDQDSLSEAGLYGQAYRKLTGHSHFVSDLALSNENGYALSASWDKTLRLWDLSKGTTARKFYGHTKEVYTCAFSHDNRQILSAGGDKQIVLWNTLGEKKYESDALNHQDWVSCVRYSTSNKSTKSEQAPYFASVGWDGRLKIWNTTIQVRFTFQAHEHNINSVSISPNGKYIATGGKDQKLKIWKLSNLDQPERTFEAQSTIFQIAFNPQLQWIAAATEVGVKVWNIMDDSTKPLNTLTPEIPQVELKEGETRKPVKLPMAVSLAWSSQGTRLFAGFTDGNINVWHVESQNQQ